MRAAVLRKIDTPLQVEEIALDPPQAGEVLVRIAASGVCHSDLHRYHGSFPSPLPMVMGHEGAGVVEAVGPSVQGIEVGDHVVLSIGPYCGVCETCGAGRFFHCERSASARAAGGLLDGTARLCAGGERISHHSFVSSFAEYAVVPATGAIPVRRDAPLDKVALVGCGVTTGFASVINDAQVQPGSSVAVFGCGGVGLNVLQTAALAGAATIVAVDISREKLELAEAFGATHAVDASQADPVSAIRDATGGGVDHAFEAIGSPEVVLQALASLRPGGQCLVLGWLGDAVLPVRWWELMGQRQRLQFSGFGAARTRHDIPRIVDLYMAGKLKLDELVSHTFGLDEVNKAFELLEQGEGTRSLIYPS